MKLQQGFHFTFNSNKMQLCFRISSESVAVSVQAKVRPKVEKEVQIPGSILSSDKDITEYSKFGHSHNTNSSRGLDFDQVHSLG